MSKFLIVTKTYAGDLEYFRDLCASLDRQMPEIEHHVLVDRVDLSLFGSFQSENRKVINCSDLLPEFKQFQAMGRRLWWRAPFYIVRGWIYQQIAKIAYIANLECDAALIIDSDLAIVAPIQERHVFQNGKSRFYRFPGQSSAGQFVEWHNIAMRVFGLVEEGYTGADYIGQPIIWSPKVVRMMIERIEKETGRKWYDALVGNFRFSEYILYGIFCDRVLDTTTRPVTPTDRNLCHYSWHYDLDDEEGVRKFVNDIEPHHVAVCVQSNLGLAKPRRDSIVRQFLTNDGDTPRQAVK